MKLVTPVEEVNTERFSLQSEQHLAYFVLMHTSASYIGVSVLFLLPVSEPTLSPEGGGDVQDAAVAGTR